MSINLSKALAENLRKRAFRVSLKVLRNESDAFDIAQDTMQRLLEVKDLPESPAAWCHTTALRLSLNLVRDTKNRRRLLEENPSVLTPSEINDPEQRAMLLELFARATEREGMILAYRFVLGLSSKETAKQLNVSERTVRDDLVKLRRKMKEEE